jgi:hypothetical protein
MGIKLGAPLADSFPNCKEVGDSWVFGDTKCWNKEEAGPDYPNYYDVQNVPHKDNAVTVRTVNGGVGQIMYNYDTLEEGHWIAALTEKYGPPTSKTPYAIQNAISAKASQILIVWKRKEMTISLQTHGIIRDKGGMIFVTTPAWDRSEPKKNREQTNKLKGEL